MIKKMTAWNQLLTKFIPVFILIVPAIWAEPPLIYFGMEKAKIREILGDSYSVEYLTEGDVTTWTFSHLEGDEVRVYKLVFLGNSEEVEYVEVKKISKGMNLEEAKREFFDVKYREYKGKTYVIWKMDVNGKEVKIYFPDGQKIEEIIVKDKVDEVFIQQ